MYMYIYICTYIKDQQFPSTGNITCMNKAKTEEHTLQYFVTIRRYSVTVSPGVLEHVAPNTSSPDMPS